VAPIILWHFVSTDLLYAFGGNSCGQLGISADAMKQSCMPELFFGSWSNSTVTTTPSSSLPSLASNSNNDNNNNNGASQLFSIRAGTFLSTAITRDGRLYMWDCGAKQDPLATTPL
jgi:alpha-tubulin suppressor-like RCC1 family protein